MHSFFSGNFILSQVFYFVAYLPCVSFVSCSCGARQSGDLGSSEDALDGILGFGKSNSSVISQLASSGNVKKMFAHCLDGVNGGGIFAMGHVVQPKVNTTPLVPNQYVLSLFLNKIIVFTHLNLFMNSVSMIYLIVYLLDLLFLLKYYYIYIFNCVE